MEKSITLSGSNINLVKSHNMRALLLSLLKEGQVSRVELAKKLSLSNTTITNLANELLDMGIIVEEPVQDIDGRKVGRPRTMLQLVPTARYAIGVHIGIGIIRVAVTDLFANMVYNELNNFDLGSSPEEILAEVISHVERAIQASGVNREQLVGVGVGASGLVDHKEGVNVLAPRLGWENIPIREVMEANLRLPVCVDNNVRTMALAEAVFGDGQGVETVVFVYGRIGVGSGIVVNGRVFHGSNAGAGEIGHTTIIPQGGDTCTCGNKGCLETLLSEPVWVQHAETVARENPQSLIAGYLQGQGQQYSNQSRSKDVHWTNPESPSFREDGQRTKIEMIFAAARDGDTHMQDYIAERACYLGIALANLVNILNPELIILGGMFAQGSDLILPAAEEKMRATSFARLGEKAKLTTTRFGWRAGVTGAATLALTTFFYHNEERTLA